MTLIVVQLGFGSFEPPKECREFMKARGSPNHAHDLDDMPRTDPQLIEWVQTLQHEEGDLVVLEIPDGTDWMIVDAYGDEYVAERHKTWEWPECWIEPPEKEKQED